MRKIKLCKISSFFFLIDNFVLFQNKYALPTSHNKVRLLHRQGDKDIRPKVNALNPSAEVKKMFCY